MRLGWEIRNEALYISLLDYDHQGDYLISEIAIPLSAFQSREAEFVPDERDFRD